MTLSAIRHCLVANTTIHNSLPLLATGIISTTTLSSKFLRSLTRHLREMPSHPGLLK
ncbi:hypothetical protein PIB30_080445, partial [Stylosanthes scabra]|nr:hypothetical protein [Stylosanthes scabra]